MAFYSCHDKEEKQIVQRSLYLLKKTLFIWPRTKIRFEQLKQNLSKIMNQE